MNDADETLPTQPLNEAQPPQAEDQEQEEDFGTEFPGDDDEEDEEGEEDDDDENSEDEDEDEDEDEEADDPAWIEAFEKLKQMPPAEVLGQVRDFIGRYLVCSDDQRTLLALWALHTYCFGAFSVTPYLDIRSAEKGCGKSVCLQLLNVLCRGPWLAAGAQLPLLTGNVLLHEFTILLDDWHSIFRSSDNQPIVSLLVRGSRSYGYCTDIRPKREETFNAFCPKAFAGIHPLPPALALRSVPILLKRRKPHEQVQHFRGLIAQQEARPLIDWMDHWKFHHFRRLYDNAEAFTPGASLSGLLPHQQERADPFLFLADLIGGHWPQRTREALQRVFGAQFTDNLSARTRLLADIRAVFAARQNPDRIRTQNLLKDLITPEDSPWKKYHRGTKALTPNGLGDLLGDIRSRTLSFSGDHFKGFLLTDFVDDWERYLGPVAHPSEPIAATTEVVANTTSKIEVVTTNSNIDAGQHGATT